MCIRDRSAHHCLARSGSAVVRRVHDRSDHGARSGIRARICTRAAVGFALACMAALAGAGRVRAISTSADQLDSALRLTPNLERGERAFETCAACHGRDGQGAADGSVPAIAGQYARVLVKQVVAFRHDQRLNIRMQHFVDQHHVTDPQQLADVIGYVSSLPTRQPAVPVAWTGPSAELYTRSCRTCHGEGGQGDERTAVPRLSGQHPQYVLEQLQDCLEGRRPAMLHDHPRQLLQSVDLAALAAYASSLQPSSQQESSRDEVAPTR